MKITWRTEILGIAVLVALVIISIHYYAILPDRMPIHFGPNGKANGWAGKDTFFIMWAAIIIFSYLLITFLPFIDPLRKKIEPRFNVLLLTRDVVLIALAVIFLASMNAALGGKSYMNYMSVFIGILLIIIGNYMPKFPQNWFVGIKTPWTISSEVVWKKTHVFGGWTFTVGGVLYVVATLLKFNPAVSVALILLAAFIPVAYSFVLYKQLEKAKGTGEAG